MKAIITSIKLKKRGSNRCYWQITLNDSSGKELEVIDLPKLSDPVNFRMQTFGILAATNCYDLLRLFNSNPVNLNVRIKDDLDHRLEYIKNLKGYVFMFDENKYVLKQESTVMSIINKHKEVKGEIESITSESGVFAIRIRTPYYTTFYQTGQIYYGFGFPFYGSNDIDQKSLEHSAKMFKSFIEKIMALYGVNDLVDLCGTELVEYPIVDVLHDESGRISAIGSEENGMFLEFGDGSYKISDRSAEIKKDSKRLTLN